MQRKSKTKEERSSLGEKLERGQQIEHEEQGKKGWRPCYEVVVEVRWRWLTPDGSNN
jgi:hypothetical protein